MVITVSPEAIGPVRNDSVGEIEGRGCTLRLVRNTEHLSGRRAVFHPSVVAAGDGYCRENAHRRPVAAGTDCGPNPSGRYCGPFFHPLRWPGAPCGVAVGWQTTALRCTGQMAAWYPLAETEPWTRPQSPDLPSDCGLEEWAGGERHEESGDATRMGGRSSP